MPDRQKRRRDLGSNLRVEREAISMTRDELAAKLSTSAAQIKNWELGRARIPAELLLDIAEALGVRVERLLSGHSFRIMGRPVARAA